MTEPTEFYIVCDRVDDWLEKAAGHKYLRRIPTGKAKPKYRYVYSVNSKAHGAPVQAGEKVRISDHDTDMAGHYEVINAGRGKVKVRHDETGDVRTLTLDAFRQMFMKEHLPAITEKRRKLKRDYEVAKKQGSEWHITARYEELLAFEKMFPETLPKYEGQERVDALRRMGDFLYGIDAVEELNQKGFNKFDYRSWEGLSGSRLGPDDADHLHSILKKYKRQLCGQFGEAEYNRCGLDARNPSDLDPEDEHFKVEKHARWGSVLVKPKVKLKSALFKPYVALQKKHGMRFDGTERCWYIPKKGLAAFDHDAYRKDMADLGLNVPEFKAALKVDVEREERTRTTAKDVAEGIRRKQVRDKIAVVKKGEKWAFYSPYNPDFNALFSNKTGQLSGITEYDPSDHARVTNSLELAEEAIQKLKDNFHGYEVVVDGDFELAQQARDTKNDALREPIPEVAAKLNPDIKLFPYQNEGVRFLIEKDGNAILGDDMGLGKTLQALSYVASQNKKAIVVVPKVVRKTWIDEGEKFFPGHFKSKELKPADLRKNPNMDLSGLNMVTVNYESLEKFRPLLEKAGFDTLIVDESHRVKNPKAKITQTITSLSKTMKHRILMSGTAAKNKREEFYTQTEIVKPGFFASKYAIKNSTIGGMWHKLSAIYLARQKDRVLTDLPDKTSLIMSQKVKGADKVRPKGIEDFSQARVDMAKLKKETTVEMAKEFMGTSDSSMLIFTESKEVAEQIAADLGDKAILHHGQMSDDRREKAKADFQKGVGPARVFVTTRQSMAVGATLTRADKVIFNDLPWTPADVRQAEDRAYRIGQKNNVNVYWNTASNSAFDEAVADILRHKYHLTTKANAGRQLTPDEREWMETPVSPAEVLAQLNAKEEAKKAPKKA